MIAGSLEVGMRGSGRGTSARRPTATTTGALPSPEPGWAGRALPALLAATVCLPLLVLAASALLSWQQVWRQAGLDMLRTADAAAEYAGRVLDGNLMLLQRVDDLMRDRSDAEIAEQEFALHNEMNRMLAGLPGGLTSFVLDREGRPLVSANFYPVPSSQRFSDESFQVMAGPHPPETHISRVLRSRTDGALYFALSRRRTGSGNGAAAGAFDGMVNISIDPRELNLGLGQMLGDAGDLITLARQDGAVLASTAGFDKPPPPLADRPALQAMARGERRASLAEEPDRLVALRQVAGWPAYALAERPRAEVVATWRTMLLPQLAVAIPATALLAGLAVMVWRQQRALAATYRSLEARVAERTAALAASEAEFRAAFESAVMGKAQVSLEELRLTRANNRFSEITGRSPVQLAHGPSLAELGLLPPGTAGAAALRAAVATGRYEAEREITRPDGRTVWVHFNCAPIGPAGRPLGLLVAIQDITDRKLAEERQALLSRELNHRAKNALAVVQAAMRLTPKQDARLFAKAIEGRVGALARAQSLLSTAQWRGAELRALVEGELAAFLVGGEADPRVRLVGPSVVIPATRTQALSMALHELATNAVKHGALSVPAGRLVVEWRMEETSVLRLEWRERGGPALPGPPARTGFGSRLLQATVTRQLGGGLDLHWEPAGLRCVLVVPMLQQMAAEEA